MVSERWHFLWSKGWKLPFNIIICILQLYIESNFIYFLDFLTNCNSITNIIISNPFKLPVFIQQHSFLPDTLTTLLLIRALNLPLNNFGEHHISGNPNPQGSQLEGTRSLITNTMEQARAEGSVTGGTDVHQVSL